MAKYILVVILCLSNAIWNIYCLKPCEDISFSDDEQEDILNELRAEIENYKHEAECAYEDLKSAVDEFIAKAKTDQRGPKGQKGDPGDIGAKGEVGSKGQKGDKGVSGNKGRLGEKGVKGQKGQCADFAGSCCYWIGLTDEETEGTWQWGNGKPFVIPAWSPEQPNDFDASYQDERQFGADCAVLNGNGLWYDVSCDSPYPFICEISIPV